MGEIDECRWLDRGLELVTKIDCYLSQSNEIREDLLIEIEAVVDEVGRKRKRKRKFVLQA